MILALTILDYAASVPDSFSGGLPPTTVPQTPIQLAARRPGMYLAQTSAAPVSASVLLSADIGFQNIGPDFNDALQVRIYRDGNEIFNTQIGTQTVSALSNYYYNLSVSTVDLNVPVGFHVYQLEVAAIISVVGKPLSIW